MKVLFIGNNFSVEIIEYAAARRRTSSQTGFAGPLHPLITKSNFNLSKETLS